jgi:putative flippase GtrA
MRRLAGRQFVRFVLVGVLNTAFGYGVYAAMLYLGFSYPIASLTSLLLGILFSFQTQGRLVFGDPRQRLLPRFALAWAVIYALNLGLIASFVRFGLDAYTAGALALVPTVVLSYLVQKFIVFRAPAR